MNTGRNSKQTHCLCRDTGGKGKLLGQRTSFNTLDNWGHKTPIQPKKRKDDRKEKVKGSWPWTHTTLSVTKREREKEDSAHWNISRVDYNKIPLLSWSSQFWEKHCWMWIFVLGSTPPAHAGTRWNKSSDPSEAKQKVLCPVTEHICILAVKTRNDRAYLYISCENTQWHRSICLHTSTLVSKADHHWVCTLSVNIDCLFNCYSWIARCDINTRTQVLSLIPNVCLELSILIKTSLTLRLTARMSNIIHDSHKGGKGCLYQAYSIFWLQTAARPPWLDLH